MDGHLAVFGVKITGIDETKKKLSKLRSSWFDASNRVLDDAADKFIEYAREVVPFEKGNLSDSIKVLESERYLSSRKSRTVGVDLEHTPATRAKKVGQYSPYVPSADTAYFYLDYAQEKTEIWLGESLNDSMNEEIREAGFVGTITGSVSNVLGSVGRMFGFRR